MFFAMQLSFIENDYMYEFRVFESNPHIDGTVDSELACKRCQNFLVGGAIFSLQP